MTLTKEAVLGAQDLERREVYVKEWDLTVWISQMSGQMRDDYEEYRNSLPVKADGNTLASVKGLREYAVAACMVDESGNRIFSNGDCQELGKKNADVIDKLFAVVDDLNKLTNDAIEELEKKSEAVQNGDTG